MSAPYPDYGDEMGWVVVCDNARDEADNPDLAIDWDGVLHPDKESAVKELRFASRQGETCYLGVVIRQPSD